MPGPLSGYRIIDLTAMISGPLATMILADQGADVIKVESLAGDHTRAVSSRRGGFSASFLNNNRNKRSIAPDKLTGITAAQAITAALLARERTGEGQHVRLSMLDSVIAFLWSSDMSNQTFVGDEAPQEKAQSFIDLIYETRDGYISVAVQTDRQWASLARALERPEWLEDPRFLTAAGRQEHIDARLNMTQEVLRERTSAEWLDRLDAADVPCAPVLRRKDVIRHPQVLANETVVEVEHPRAGRLRQ